MLSFEELTTTAKNKIAEKALPELYSKRLKFEIQEVKKQGIEGYWTGLYNEGVKYEGNPGGLLLPWLLDMVADDPLANTEQVTTSCKYTDIMEYYKKHDEYPLGIRLDPDKPDIDIDFLPKAKSLITEYAKNKYSADVDDDYGRVCAVSSWTTYKFKSALADVAKAHLNMEGWPHHFQVEEIAKKLPDDMDAMQEGGFGFCRGSVIDPVSGAKTPCKTSFREARCPKCKGADTETPTLGRLIEDVKELRELHAAYPKLVDIASRLVGKVQGQGQHAGAMVISNEPLYGNLPLYKRPNSDWMSLWTEGRVTQLSKYGFTKWDILGLLNLQYIYECCQAIQRNHGISFGDNLVELFDTDPDDDRLGWYIKANGERVKIRLNDEGAFGIANQVRTDGIFQFDTPVAQNILKQCNSLSGNNAVRNIQDLISINALGHPGPMQMIPDFIKNRENTEGTWRKDAHPEFLKVIGETYNCIVFQEQLAALWQNIAGFSSVQAQESRKAVAKKWLDKLRPIEEMWMAGASKMIGEAEAAEWWGRMVTFGRYAFNKSHALAYCLVAYTCMWLKQYFPLEFWEAVFSGSDDHEKRVRYIGAARFDGIIIKEVDVDQLSENYYAHCAPRENHTDDYEGYIVQGLNGIKSFGSAKAKAYGDAKRSYTSISEFVEVHGKDKKSMERLINLGAFDKIHYNRKALWLWYQINYCTGDEVKMLKEEHKLKYFEYAKWTEDAILEYRQKQIDEYKLQNPKKKIIPKKILEWVPVADKDLSIFEEMYSDYTYKEILDIEKELLGMHLHNPMHQFNYNSDNSIMHASVNDVIDCIVVNVTNKMTKATEKQKSKSYIMLEIDDGVQTGRVFLWNDSLKFVDKHMLKPGTGLRLIIEYNEAKGMVSLARNTALIALGVRQAQSWRDVVSEVALAGSGDSTHGDEESA